MPVGSIVPNGFVTVIGSAAVIGFVMVIGSAAVTGFVTVVRSGAGIGLVFRCVFVAGLSFELQPDTTAITKSMALVKTYLFYLIKRVHPCEIYWLYQRPTKLNTAKNHSIIFLARNKR